MANPRRRDTLSDVKLRRLKPAPQGHRYDVWDSVVPGLSIRVTDSGRKTWTVLGRIRGQRKVIRVTVGTYPVLGLGLARERAREKLEAMTDGRDPRSRGLAVSAAWKLYVADRAHWGDGHRANVDSAWRLHIEPAIGAGPLRSVSRADVAEILAAIKAPVNSNRVRQALTGFFRWALERDLVDVNPVAAISRRPERSRDRVYTDPELRAIWKGAEALEWPYGPLVRFLLVTAQRRAQAGRMRWSEIDEERELWTSPTKAKRLHPIPLSSLAREILKAAPPGEREFVFTFGKRGVTNWGYIRSHMKPKPGIPADFRPHDLRRTAATRMAELGVRREVVDAVLDHAQGGVSGVYQRYQYLPEMRHALTLWSDRLRQILASNT